MITSISLSIVAKNQTTQLYKKIEELSQGVKKDLRNKGLVIPTKQEDGSVKFSDYIVVKTDKTYAITNIKGAVVIDEINLVQTAILLANNLALGKYLDTEIVALDRQYGFNNFEDDQFTRVINTAISQKDWVRAEILTVKQEIAHNKAVAAQKLILLSFEKLRRIR
jgi:hypothetical protein